jgi:CheY-like chemotaxis protein
MIKMKNVLLVDDDSICNLISTRILEQTGVFNNIHTALNGVQALNLLNDYYAGSSMPEVILLDLNMPVMDGFGFMEAYNKISLSRKENVKIIIVSTSNDPKDVLRAKEMGATDFIVKPLTEANLMNVLVKLKTN